MDKNNIAGWTILGGGVIGILLLIIFFPLIAIALFLLALLGKK